LPIFENQNEMLLSHYTETFSEAGCDEAGRGCLAGPVFAAAVMLPHDFREERLTDSKQLSEKQRNTLIPIIRSNAIAWAVASVDAHTIDEINILNAAIMAMHLAVSKLKPRPQFLLVDGNRFKPYKGIPHQCIIRGDATYLSIAAASVLAKTSRDEYMKQLHREYPVYGWERNKGYPSKLHREMIVKFGITPYHRKTFRMNPA